MKKVAIIGAGPIGLYFASICEYNEMPYVVYEASDKIGGQINLYPNKKFLDVNGFYNKCSIEFITDLKNKINVKNIRLNTKVTKLETHNNFVTVFTDNSQDNYDYVIIAIGLGNYTPRTMELENENKCKNILYSLNDFSFLKNKKVAIFGGGDTALDWAREISLISNDVHLVHRRLEFRGNADTIKDSKNLKIHLPYIPTKITLENNLCKNITIKNVNSDELITLDVDYVLVNYGSVPVINNFNLETEGHFFKIKENYSINERIYAAGDCVAYPNKIRRIEPGKKEADTIFAFLAQLD